jgi:hypothetical protein
MKKHIFIAQTGDHSFKERFLNNFQNIIKQDLGGIRQETYYFEDKEINVDFYYSCVSKSPNLVFKQNNGPVLLHKESGFDDSEIDYFIKRCVIAKGKQKILS